MGLHTNQQTSLMALYVPAAACFQSYDDELARVLIGQKSRVDGLGTLLPTVRPGYGYAGLQCKLTMRKSGNPNPTSYQHTPFDTATKTNRQHAL